MEQYISLALVLLSTCHADYTIRTRQQDDREVLTMTSPMVISTISTPPYMGTSFNQSSGFVLDLLKFIQGQGGIPEKFDLRVTNEATPGVIAGDRWTGLVDDAKNKYTHFAVGPIFDNVFLAEQKIYFSSPWHTPLLKLVARANSELAERGVATPTPIDLSSVELILVENSAELQRLSDFRMPSSAGLSNVQDAIRKKKPTLVRNVCDGLRKLGVIDDKDDPVEGPIKQSSDQILLLNSFEADHYASGNELLKVMSPPGARAELGFFAFMSHFDFQKFTKNITAVLGKHKKEIDDIVKKWSKYDKDACKKLRKALSSSSPLGSSNLWLSVLAALILANFI